MAGPAEIVAQPTPRGESPGRARPVVGAAVDLGSTSVHLLVAVVDGRRLEPLVDESVFLGLGTVIADRGYLGGPARAELTAALVRYADMARGLGAGDVTLIGTEPIRRAADAATIVGDVVVASGAPLHVVSHREEAFLTLLGVTEGRPVVHELLVVDVGGGSSEFCMVGADGRPRADGLRLGSSRLTDAHVSHDPPTDAEIWAMRAAAHAAVMDAPPARPTEIVAVGGTASNLIKVLPSAAIDRTLTRERIAEAIHTVTREPAALAAQRHLINPARARLLPAGGAILDAVLDRYGLDRISVSEAGVREGTIRAVDHAGAGWRDRLAVLAHGWDA
jgi:exopolyphosphatase/guanosine-5'-triphosphate,3'-diphosphate pyrophosphatase